MKIPYTVLVILIQILFRPLYLNGTPFPCSPLAWFSAGIKPSLFLSLSSLRLFNWFRVRWLLVWTSFCRKTVRTETLRGFCSPNCGFFAPLLQLRVFCGAAAPTKIVLQSLREGERYGQSVFLCVCESGLFTTRLST